eukprot:UN29789
MAIHRKRLVNVLMEFGFPPSQQNLLTILQRKEWKLADKMLKCISGKADDFINSKLPWGGTMLTHTTRYTDFDAILWLIQKGAKTDDPFKAYDGLTARQIAVSNLNKDIICCPGGHVMKKRKMSSLFVGQSYQTCFECKNVIVGTSRQNFLGNSVRATIIR